MKTQGGLTREEAEGFYRTGDGVQCPADPGGYLRIFRKWRRTEVFPLSIPDKA